MLSGFVHLLHGLGLAFSGEFCANGHDGGIRDGDATGGQVQGIRLRPLPASPRAYQDLVEIRPMGEAFLRSWL